MKKVMTRILTDMMSDDDGDDIMVIFIANRKVNWFIEHRPRAKCEKVPAWRLNIVNNQIHTHDNEDDSSSDDKDENDQEDED